MSYSTLANLMYGSFDPNHNRQIVFLSTGAPVRFEKDVWYDIRMVWGDGVMTFYIDGRLFSQTPFTSLFGNMTPSEPIFAELGMSRDYEGMISMGDFHYRSGSGNRRAIGVPRLSEADRPAIDGESAEPLWRNAALLAAFCRYNSDWQAAALPEMDMACTESVVYVAGRIPMPEQVAPRAILTEDNAAIYNEDSVEIRLQPPDGTIHAFLVSALGTRYEAVRAPGAESAATRPPSFQAAARMGDNDWRFEAFIPYAALGQDGPPEPGAAWRGNVYVNRSGGMSDEHLTWGAAATSFWDSDYFSDITFLPGTQGVRMEKMEGLDSGQVVLGWRKVGGLTPVTTVTAALYNGSGHSVGEYSQLMNDSEHAEWLAEPLGPGPHTLAVSATNPDGTVLLATRLHFVTSVNIRSAVENYPYAGYAKVDIHYPAVIGGEECRSVRVELQSEGRAIDTHPAKILSAGRAEARLATDELAPGEYDVFVVALGEGGKEIDRAANRLKIFPKPDWFKNDYGIDHTVPVPWTAVEAIEDGLRVVGRDYVFGKQWFPRQIVNKGDPMWADAPTFRLKAGNAVLDLAGLAVEKREIWGDVVCQTARTRVANCQVKVESALEFDGCMRIDLEVEPPPGGATLNELVLAIPIRREWAERLLAGARAQNVVELDQDRQFAFTPNNWVGCDRGGLALFFESDQFWTRGDSSAISWAVDGDRVILTVTMIRAPRKIDDPLRMTFGLMATPVKALDRPQVFAMQKWNGIGDGTAMISRPEAIGYHEISGMAEGSGTLEFFFRRPSATAMPRTHLCSLKARDEEGLLRVFHVGGELAIETDRTRSARFPVQVGTDRDHHFALAWNDATARVFLDGQPVGSVDMPESVRRLLKDATKSEFLVGSDVPSSAYVDMVVDEIRLSNVVRYADAFAPPSAPFAPDAQTTALDHLDTEPRPDGFSVYTAAGGLPTIGARPAPGKFGQGMQLVSEPRRSSGDILLNDMRPDIQLFWNWNYGMGGDSYMWPPTCSIRSSPSCAP